MDDKIQMRLVRQRCDFSCGIACAAMVSGRKFHEVKQKYGDIGNGMGSRDMGWLLRSLHVRFERLLYPEIRRTLPHIIVVPSLNHVAGMHYVVLHFDGSWNVLDPQRGRDGKKWYALNRNDPTGVQLCGYSELIRITSPAFEEAAPLGIG